MIPEGGRTSYAGDVLAIVVAETKLTARAAAELVEVEYRVLRPITDPRAAIDRTATAASSRCGAPTTTCSARASTPAATSTPRSPRARTSCTRCSRPSASSTPSSSRRARSPCPTPTAGTLHVYSRRPGRVGRPQRHRRACSASTNEQVTVELVSNGGAFGGKEDMSNQAHTALAAWLLQRPVKCTLSREESFLIHAKRHPIRHGVLGRVRRRRHAHRRCGCAPSATAAPTPASGMKVLERDGRPRQRPVPRARRSTCTRSRSAPTTRCAARSAGSAPTRRSSRWRACLDRLAEQVGISGWEIRKRNVIRPGEVWGPGQIMDDGCLGAERCLDEVKPRVRRVPSPRARPSASASG